MSSGSLTGCRLDKRAEKNNQLGPVVKSLSHGQEVPGFDSYHSNSFGVKELGVRIEKSC